MIVAAKPRGTLYDGVMVNNTVFAQLNFSSHYRESANFNVTSNSCGGRNLCAPINFAH